MLQQLGNYSDGCSPTESEARRWRCCRRCCRCASRPLTAPPSCARAAKCQSQEASLALLWTLGIFTLNCGPVVMGFVLDFLGPKLTGILGARACAACRPWWPLHLAGAGRQRSGVVDRSGIDLGGHGAAPRGPEV